MSVPGWAAGLDIKSGESDTANYQLETGHSRLRRVQSAIWNALGGRVKWTDGNG